MNEPGSKRSRRRAGLRLAIVAAILTLPAFGSSSATADQGYDYLGHVGAGLQLSHPTDMAVDNSSGPSAHDLYVTDTGNARVVKVGPDGGLILMFGDEVDATTGGDVCTAASGDVCQPGRVSMWELSEGEPSPGFSYVSQVAVDGSSGPSAGDVYVTDVPHDRVLKFDSSGHRITSWGDEGELQVNWLVGIAVDSSGRLLVREGGGSVVVRAFEADGSEASSREIDASPQWEGFGVDSLGNLFMRSGWWTVEELGLDGSRLRSFETPREIRQFAVNASNGDVFAAQGQRGISRFLGNCTGSPCSPAATFGEGFLGWAGTLAIDEGDGTLYAFELGSEQLPPIAVLLPSGLIPNLSSGAASTLDEESAYVVGEIDPDGAPPSTECHFEYATQAAFAANGFSGAPSVPCWEPPPFGVPTNVSANLSGLRRGTSYRYRLTARTAGRPSVGATVNFTTPILPRATTGAASEVGRDAATLTGSVISPAGRIVIKCVFEYVEDHKFLAQGFGGAESVPCTPAPFYPDESPVDVKAKANFLQAGTTYHYRVVAINTDGKVPGASREFATRPVPVEAPEPEPPEPHEHHPSHAVRCSKRACVHTLVGSTRARTWTSPKFPRTYGWLFAVYSEGSPLHYTELEKNCTSTFTGNGLIVRLNACHGRFRLVYRGADRLRLRWRVFEHCRCAERREARRTRPALPRR